MLLNLDRQRLVLLTVHPCFMVIKNIKNVFVKANKNAHGCFSFVRCCVKVYSATNVELVTRSRTEHLSDQDKSRSKGNNGYTQIHLITEVCILDRSWRLRNVTLDFSPIYCIEMLIVLEN